jgi:hypothetical protein
MGLGTLAILLSPLSKKKRDEFRQDFDKTYGRFYTEQVLPKGYDRFQAEHDPALTKLVGAAIKVTSNLYLHTLPEAQDAPLALQFGRPESRFRYLVFCLSAVETACGREMKNPDAVVKECLHFLVGWAITENAQEFFGGPVDSQAAASNGSAYLEEFMNNWSSYIETVRGGNREAGTGVICSMIRTTESNDSSGEADVQRLRPLGEWIEDNLAPMRSAFMKLADLTPA